MDATSTTPATSPCLSATEPAAPVPQVPGFFAQAPRILVRDRLAQALGAAQDGVLAYEYLDAVKLAGHSCPTVAGAWLMTRAALARLYPQTLPERGGLRVELREPQDAGVAGVIASVAGLVTGAAGAGGFKGLAGQHARRDLVAFGQPMAGDLRFTRLDTGCGVQVSHHPQAVPRPAGLAALMQAALAPAATVEARQAFAAARQGWVRRLLIDHADDPALITLQD